MRIKLTDPKWATFTGRLGPIDFTDGVSDYGVAPQQRDALTMVVSSVEVSEPNGNDAELAAVKAELEQVKKEFEEYKQAHPSDTGGESSDF